MAGVSGTSRYSRWHEPLLIGMPRQDVLSESLVHERVLHRDAQIGT